MAVSARTPAGWSTVLAGGRGKGHGPDARGLPRVTTGGALNQRSTHLIVAVQLADFQKSGSHSKAHVRFSAAPPSVALMSPGLAASARNHTYKGGGKGRGVQRTGGPSPHHPRPRSTHAVPPRQRGHERDEVGHVHLEEGAVRRVGLYERRDGARYVRALLHAEHWARGGQGGGCAGPADAALALRAARGSLTMTLSLAHSSSDGTEIKV